MNRLVTRLGMAVAALAALASPAAAIEWGRPTDEQAERCDRQAESRDRNDCRWAYAVGGLKFPGAPEEPGFFTSTARMGIFKPRGDGPFPALILLHTCAAVDIDPQHMPYWVGHALSAGYVAFVVDSWKQRGIAELCQSAPPGFLAVHLAVRTRDAYDALAHLAKYPFIDAARIAAMGFSNGGRVAYQIVRKAAREMYALDSRRFAASIAVYGKCQLQRQGVTVTEKDIDQPLLALMGDLDKDGDPAFCVPWLESLRASAAPVEWHVFERTGHSWDMPINARPRVISYLGQPDGVLFAYNPQTTESTREKAFAFLARRLNPPK